MVQEKTTTVNVEQTTEEYVTQYTHMKAMLELELGKMKNRNKNNM